MNLNKLVQSLQSINVVNVLVSEDLTNFVSVIDVIAKGFELVDVLANKTRCVITLNHGAMLVHEYVFNEGTFMPFNESVNNAIPLDNIHEVSLTIRCVYNNPKDSYRQLNLGWRRNTDDVIKLNVVSIDYPSIKHPALFNVNSIQL